MSYNHREYMREWARRRRAGDPTKGTGAAVGGPGTGNYDRPKPTRDLIEQAIARGLPASRIMADLGVTYTAVQDVRAALEQASA